MPPTLGGDSSKPPNKREEDDNLVITPTTAGELVDRLVEDFTPDDLKTYEHELHEIHKHTRRADFVETVANKLLSNHFPSVLAAYECVRPLLIRLTCISTRAAYRSFKVLAQLQRVLRDPYIPDLSRGSYVLNTGKTNEKFIKMLGKFAAIAVLIYEKEDLAVFPEKLVLPLSPAENFRRIIGEKNYADIASRTQASPFRPAWYLMVDRKEKQLILVIRGSSSVADYITDLVCDSDEATKGRHEGMMRSAKNLHGETHDIAMKFLVDNPAYQLIITGHSLGAGTASLLTMIWVDTLEKSLSDKIRCYAYACPAVVGDCDAGKYKAHIVSVIYGKDIVPRASFGSLRDLIIMMHALARFEKSTRHQKGTGDAAEILRVIQEDEIEIQRLHHRRPSLAEENEAVTESVLVSEDSDISDREDRPVSKKCEDAKMKNLAYTFAINKLHMGGMSFNQLATILNRRCKFLDKKEAETHLDTESGPNFPWYQRFLWQIVKFLHGSWIPTTQKLDATPDQELKLLKKCYAELKALKSPPTATTLVPPGEVYLVLPELHFVAQDLLPPGPYNEALCVLIHMDRKYVNEISQNPLWAGESILEHAGTHYLRALAPELLATLSVDSSS